MHPPLSPSPASIYSRWEVEEDWCLSVLRSYQAEHGPDFPWSVGKEALGQERGLGRVQDRGMPLGRVYLTPSKCFLSAGEDMSADGRRQLALFLVSEGVGARRGA